MRAGERPPATLEGWSVFAQPLFVSQLDSLARQVDALRRQDPVRYVEKDASRRLAAIHALAFGTIPRDPVRPEFRAEDAMGPAQKHWYRAVFFRRYWLFYRCHEPSRVIVYAWIYDEVSRRIPDSLLGEHPRPVRVDSPGVLGASR